MVYNEEFEVDDYDEQDKEQGQEEQSSEEQKETGKTEESDPYFSYLKEAGVINVGDDFEYDGSDEKLQEAIELTRQKTRAEIEEDFQADLPEDFQALFQYAKAGGKDLNKFLSAYAPVDLENLDINIESNQERIIRETYKRTTNKTDESIERIISKLRDREELAEAAQESLEDLVEFQKERKANLLVEQQQAEVKERKAYEDDIRAFNDTLKTYKTEPKRREDIRKFFSPSYNDVPKFNKVLQSIRENKEHLIQLADILMDYDPKKGISTERIEKQVATKRNTSLKEAIETKIKDPKNKVGGGSINQKSNNFDWEKFLDL